MRNSQSAGRGICRDYLFFCCAFTAVQLLKRNFINTDQAERMCFLPYYVKTAQDWRVDPSIIRVLEEGLILDDVNTILGADTMQSKIDLIEQSLMDIFSNKFATFLNQEKLPWTVEIIPPGLADTL